MNSITTLDDIGHVDIELRSYGSARLGDRHDFAQLVLPVSGVVQLEIEGRESRLDPLRAAVVMPGAWHSQCSELANRSLVLDIGQEALAHGPWQRLATMPFTGIGPAARKLVEFMQLSLDGAGLAPALLRSWTGLLLDTLATGSPGVRSRLAALLASVEADPSLPWSTDAMARHAGVSVSRLHGLFREELDTSPVAWVLQARLALACRLLAGTDRPIADIALRAGFSDQTALTRALRRSLDITPAAYRRGRQETASKNR